MTGVQTCALPISSGLAQSTYAAVASSTTLAKPASSSGLRPARSPALHKEPSPDNRLFVRLPNDHPARDIQGHAILTSLRGRLGPEAPLLKEVQPTKTGFALCLASLSAHKALEAKRDIISGLFSNYPIE